jgi:hypothetical protein
MADTIAGFLEVGTNKRGEVVINLDRDQNGIGHVVFSPTQARTLAKILNKQAALAEVGRVPAPDARKN